MEARPPRKLRVLCGGRYLFGKVCIQFAEQTSVVSYHGHLSHATVSVQRVCVSVPTSLTFTTSVWQLDSLAVWIESHILWPRVKTVSKLGELGEWRGRQKQGRRDESNGSSTREGEGRWKGDGWMVDDVCVVVYK